MKQGQTKEATGAWPVRIDGVLGAVETPDRQAQGQSDVPQRRAAR